MNDVKRLPNLLLALLLSTLSVFSHADARSSSRIATLVANEEYDSKLFPSLKSPIQDINALEEKLKQMGFDVTKYENLNAKNLVKTIDMHVEKAEKAKVALWFYAGYGMMAADMIGRDQLDYMIPIDANIRHATDAALEAVPTEKLTRKLKAQAYNTANIVILDSCRSNDLPTGSRGSSQTVASNSPMMGGVFLAYSSSKGQCGVDSMPGKNEQGSPYMAALLNYIDYPASISDVFSLVTRQVAKETGGNQRPVWTNGLHHILCLNPQCGILQQLKQEKWNNNYQE